MLPDINATSAFMWENVESDFPWRLLLALLQLPPVVFHAWTTMTMSLFQSSPYEILLPIFSHCIVESEDPCQQLSFFERTCKQFERIIFDSALWCTSYTILFGSSAVTQALSIDWKAQCKKNIVLLRSIRPTLNIRPDGNQYALHKYAVTLKELWIFVRSMSKLILCRHQHSIAFNNILLLKKMEESQSCLSNMESQKLSLNFCYKQQSQVYHLNSLCVHCFPNLLTRP